MENKNAKLSKSTRTKVVKKSTGKSHSKRAIKSPSGKSTAGRKVKTKSVTHKTTARKTTTRKPIARKTVARKALPRKPATRKTASHKEQKIQKVTSNAELTSAQEDPTLPIIAKCVKALDDKKAMDLRVLDMRGKSPITNYVILATANSEPHMRALSLELEKLLKEMHVEPVRREFGAGSGWFVVDAFDFMAHIFLSEQRGAYRMDSLWKDAPEIKF